MKENKYYNSILGSFITGFIEIPFFHPIDTIGKRLMSHQNKIIKNNFQETNNNLKKIILQEHMSIGWLKGYKTLFPGIQFAMGYKIFQKIFKFGGQKTLNDYFFNNYNKLKKSN